MKICVISPIDEKIPPEFYGGIGRIVNNLTNGLIKNGNDVTLLAPGDSKTLARLIPIIPKSLGTNNPCNSPKAREACFQMTISNIIKILSREKFDIVNNHFGWRLIPFSVLISTPFITTLHTPLDQENKRIIFSNYTKTPVISISNSQRRPLPNLNYIGTIYNGIDISLFDFSNIHNNYLVFLGRMSPEKGILEAIQIANKIKAKLIIAGAVHDWDRRYFESTVKQYIDNKNIIFIGEINDKQKNKLLGKAKALLAPIQWEEPFGLTFIEAMACGTPVIALDRGSVKEIVVNKTTGIVVNSITDIYRCFNEIDNINRINCRQHVEEKFTVEKMVNSYEKIYSDFLKKYYGENK